MYFQKDYILRQIEMFGKGVAKLLKVETPTDYLDDLINADGSVRGDQYLGFTLTSMVRDGKIGEAEDLLYETVEAHPHAEYLPIAVDFYKMLAELDEKKLQEADFSQQEIVDGLAGIQRIFEEANQRNA